MQQVGIWMIVRILVFYLLPIAWYLLLGGLNNMFLDAIFVIIELIYAWQFYRLLH